MNWTTIIPILLSNHRHPQNSAQPLTLTLQQILSLLQHAAPHGAADWRTEAVRVLDELQAQGEILVGMGKRYCIAPPTVLAQSQQDMVSLQFQGDRAYLPLVHQTLKTNQSQQELLIRPFGQNFQRIQDDLQRIGVCLLSVEDSLQKLPCPRLPLILRSPLEENPFTTYSTLEIYTSQTLKSQTERWQSRSSYSTQALTSDSLLKLPTGEYLWLRNGEFYELEPETAVLAMFAQDSTAEHPLLIEWDEAPGRLNLQGIILPSAYARWLWRLSEPDPNHYRTRLISPAGRPFIKEAFARLGCQLV
jgi:hypothetical protein